MEQRVKGIVGVKVIVSGDVKMEFFFKEERRTGRGDFFEDERRSFSGRKG